jgi:hypothetical protein
MPFYDVVYSNAHVLKIPIFLMLYSTDNVIKQEQMVLHLI